MDREQIISALNEEIASLISARDLLMPASPVVSTANPVATRGLGRPKGSTNKATSPSLDNDASKGRRSMSTEGKARIAEAQRKRWAALKKASKPASTKQSSAAKKVVQKTAPPAAKKTTTTSRKSVPKKAPAKKSAPPAAPATAGSGTE